MTYGDGKFIVTKDMGSGILSSSDGINWTSLDVSLSSVDDMIFVSRDDTTTTDTTSPTVSSTSPSDSDTSVPISSSISVTFSEAMDNTSVTTNTSNTTCSGTFQVSSDSFSSCVKMSSSSTSSNVDKTLTVDPSSNLSYATSYKIRVTTGVKDVRGNTLGSQYETSSGFTTSINWAGTQQFGPMGDSVVGIVLDSSENIYIAGVVKVDLDGQSVAGGNDFMLIKFNHLGVKQWTKLKGTSSYDQAYGLTIDSSDNLYTFGGYDGANNTNSDMSVVKHDSDGNFQWVKTLDNSSISFDGGNYVAIDSSGNIFTGAGDTVGKFNSSGEMQWQVSQSNGEGIVLDSSGNVYVSEDNVTLTKYNSSGTVQWSNTLSSSGNDYVEGIAIDSSDNIFITGSTSGDLDGNTNANSNSESAGSYDAFLIKYDSSGNKQWTKQIGTSTYEKGRSVTTDTNGNIYLTGETMGSLDGNTSIGSVDVFLTKYNSSGTKQWTKQFGTTSTDRGVAVTTDNSSSVYVTGETSGGFDGYTHSGYTNCGGTCPDMFLIKYNSDGVKQ